MKNTGTRCVKRKLSAKNCRRTNSTIMEDQSFSNLQHHRHPFPLNLSNFQNSEGVYPLCQTGQDSLERYGEKEEESTNSYLMSNSAPKTSIGSGEKMLLSTSASSLDGDVDKLDGSNSHFEDSWNGKKELWEDGETYGEDFNGKGDYYADMNDVFYIINYSTEEEERQKLRANHHNYVHVSCEANKDKMNEKSHSYYRVDSRGRGCFQDEEDNHSSSGSGEDQSNPVEAESTWLSVSPPAPADGTWRGACDSHNTSSVCLSPVGTSSKMYSQKLDSFSEAFLSQRKRLAINPNPLGPMWEYGAAKEETSGLAKSRQSCAFDPDPSQPPSSSSSSSPAYPSLPSFPSPPTSSHFMPSVLSPPPTPLPPSQSPCKMDSPGAQGGAGALLSHKGETLGSLQFFPSRVQSSPSVHSSEMRWKLPLLSHCFQANPCAADLTIKSYHETDYGDTAVLCSIPQSPESSSLTSSSYRSSLSSAISPSSNSSLTSYFHLPLRTSHTYGKHPEVAKKISTEKIKSEPAWLNQQQQQKSLVYPGTLFPSILHSSRTQNDGWYTPRPLLNPIRTGSGLYSSLISFHCKEETDCVKLPHVNIGPDHQANLPPCFSGGEWSDVCLQEEEHPREQLLWKPWNGLEESVQLQNEVGKLLSMSSSSCLPGGGSNTELALHWLHRCQGNSMHALEQLLFCWSSPTADYHYSGCDFWTETEKKLFNVALGSSGKDFTLIQKMVRTKSVSQCVEFYYLSKKLTDKKKKHKENECRVRELELQKNMIPVHPVEKQFPIEEAAPVPPLASFFPCKLCGKMFYKIKSRNAHMKIHRQPQEDWSDRRLQHQLLTQHLTLSHRPTNPLPADNLLPRRPPTLAFPTSSLPSNSSSNVSNVHNPIANSNPITLVNTGLLGPSNPETLGNIAPLTSHIITVGNIGGSNTEQRELSTAAHFHQQWGSFARPHDLSGFYCLSEGKQDSGVTERKDPVSWQ